MSDFGEEEDTNEKFWMNINNIHFKNIDFNKLLKQYSCY